MKSIIPFLLYVLFHVASVEAMEAATFLPTTITSWFWQSLIVVDKWLYIDGGEMRLLLGDDDDVTMAPNNQTFAIDLTTSWTTLNVTAKVSSRDKTFLPTRRPELFYDQSHNMVYSEGGQSYGPDGAIYPTKSALPEFWGFTPSTDGSVDWAMQHSKNISDSFPLTSSVGFALATSSDSKHFSLGGTITFYNDKAEINQDMVMEDFVVYDYETRKFDNQTRSTPHSLEGGAQFAPQYGEEGVVLFFGGKDPADRGEAGLDLADLGSIQVYDIHSGNFYTQQASNAPQGRYDFCSVGVTNTQNSSFEIFVYGGTTGAYSTSAAASMSKVYILTLPAFTWLEAPTAADTWRMAHVCHSIGPPAHAPRNQRQMLSLGGVMNPMPDGTSFNTYRETWASGMKLFDLSALTWGDAYNASADAYERPGIVDNVYAGSGAYPATWGDVALKAIFNNSIPTTPDLPPTATAGSDPKPSTSGSSTGGIVGGVVGGVGGLAVIALLLWWFWWRKRAARGGAPAAELGAGGYQSPPVQGPWGKPEGVDGVNELNDTSRVELPAQKGEGVQTAHEMPAQEAYEMPAGENGNRYG